MVKLSVILATCNEEKNLEACLKSVQGLADEIVIVDGQSTDKTVQIAKKYGARIFIRPNPPMFHQNKQLAIDKAKGEWILYLDADERVSRELRKEILGVIKRNRRATVRGGHSSTSEESLARSDSSDGVRSTPPRCCDGYWLPRKNIIFGQWIRHTGWWPDDQLRLFKNGLAKLPCQSVHEQPVLKGEAGKLKNPLIHYNYRSVSQFLGKLNVYTENDKNLFLKENKKLVWLDAVRWPVAEFLKRFFKQEGYKDGLHGLVLSLLQSLAQLVTFAKVWEAQKFKLSTPPNLVSALAEELGQKRKELKYWLLTGKAEQSRHFFKKVGYKLKRKLDL